MNRDTQTFHSNTLLRSIFIVCALLMLIVAAAGVAAAAMPPVPYFSQCDSRWSGDRLGGDGPTICDAGCALTSAAMVMAYYGVDTDPQRLNDVIGRDGSADQSVAFGEPDDLPVIGDWDGDGGNNIGVYRLGSTTGVFYLDIDNDGGIADIVTPEYGDLGDIPLAGDWDGDSDDNIGVYRPGTGEFFMDATIPDVLSSKTIYVDDDFSDDPSEHRWDTIQEGVDDADDGDTVIVYAGIYYENVDVNKRVSLIGESKNTTVVNGDGSGDVIQVTADGCTVSGFTVQSRESSIVDRMKFRRGEVATGSFTWTPVNFAGFYYDINADVGNETLTIVTDSDRTVEEGDLLYQTTSDLIDFEYNNWGSYQVIGFMAEKYFAGYGENTDDNITDETISLLSNDVLSKVLIDEEETYTLSTGASLELDESYGLKITQIDVSVNKVQLELLHNGEPVSTENITTPDTYVYKKNLGTVGDVPIIALHISSVFSDTETDMVIIDGVFQISDDCSSVHNGDRYGEMEITSVSCDTITMENRDDISLEEDEIICLMGNIKFHVADNTTLRFYPMVEYTEPGFFEVRGEVQHVAGTNPEMVWNAHNFSGFYYNLDEDVSAETLRVAANTINCGAGDQTIDENRLTYRTAPVAKQYILNENEGCTVNSSNPIGDSFYWIEGWMGKRYVAINNKANKLCELIVEFDSRSDKKTLSTGENWDLGRGFALTAKEIDHDGNSVWLSLSKNGKELDNQIIDTGTGNEQDRVYTYTADMGAEGEIPVFSCYVCAVFRGTDTNLIQVKYVFLIDDHVLEIETGDRYGAMEVITASSSEIVLKNDETAIDLGAGTTVPIMDHLSFKAADDGTAIRFYPSIEKVVGSSRITEIAGIELNSTDNNILTDNEIRLSDCGIRLQNSNNNTLTGNNVNSNNEYGIYLSSSRNNEIAGNTASSNGNCGIYLYSSDNNNITGNIANNDNYYGIKIDSSSSNMLADNIVNSNRWDGVDLWYSGNNTLTGNTMSDNRYNFGLRGWNDTHFDNDIDATNLVDGKTIYYIKGASDSIIDSSIGAGAIYCIQCDNITVKNITLSNSGAGVVFWKTNNSTIEDVNASNNDCGICLWNSSNNKLTRNTILSNSRGIEVQNSSDNTLAGNMVSSNWEGINLRNSRSNNLTSNNANSNTGYGVNLWNSDNTVLMSNTISNNWGGISLRNSCSNNLTSNIVSDNGDGIDLQNSGGNLLDTNTVSGNDNGICLDYSNSNTLIDNNVDMNNWKGIYLWRSNYNTLTGNLMFSNRYNFGLFIWYDSYFDNNIDTTNLVDGEPVYYINDASDAIIDSTANAGVIYCIRCENITVKDVALTNNGVGVFFWKTNNSMIDNVNASNNDYGICICHSSNNCIANNTVNSNNRVGMHMYYSDNNILHNNTANSNNDVGIWLDSSNDNTLSDNTANSNTGWYGGIYISSSNDNKLSNNTALSNDYGIKIDSSNSNTLAYNIANSNNYHGICMGSSSNYNTLQNNNATNNKYGIYLWDSSNNILSGNNASNNKYGTSMGYGICLHHSSDNILTDNIVNSSSNNGINMWYSNNNVLSANIVSNNRGNGIGLFRSSNNTLQSNTVNSNNWNGIRLYYSSNNNILYHNNLINNNTQNACDSCTNTWDSGSEGNYYSDYTGTDNNTDGIGEDPYQIPGGGSVDRYPLMQPWTPPQNGDLNGDDHITPADAAIALAIAVGGSASCDAATLAAADVSGDGCVTSLDALMILQAAAGAITL